eukprot:TRINITY_DN662_c0_g1_i1.p1 TRINITY_DN662_c0_g1~~TRINITY_DN662_c0_g1_i1.p1  ORF type:complete len:412 (-),score=104.80 TRINITY_DN662_c0_g1_i1:227-1462(-)
MDKEENFDEPLTVPTIAAPPIIQSDSVSLTIDSPMSPDTLRKTKYAAYKQKAVTEQDFIDWFIQSGKNIEAVETTKRILRVTKNGWQESSINEILCYDVDIARDSDEVVWFDLDSPSKHDMEIIEDKFDIHPLTTEDILSTDGREKVEHFDDYLFVVARELHYAEGTNKLVSSPVSVVTFRNIVFTFHPPNMTCIPKLFFFIEKSKGGEDFMIKSDWVLYSVLNAIGELLKDYVSGIVMEGEALDELVLIFSAGEQGDLLRRIGNARRMMTTIRSQLWMKREILQGFTSKPDKFISEEIKIYFRDVLDLLLSMEQKVEVSKEMLINLHQTYLARVSLEMAEASNAVNAIMKKFAAITTLFMPLTLTTGMWGMNVRVPGGDIDNYGWFIGILIFMIIVGLGFVVEFRRRKWL